MSFYGALNPLQGLGPMLSDAVIQNTQANSSGTEAQKQFVKVFVAEMLKQTVAGMASMASTDEDADKSLFPTFDASMYNGLIVEQAAQALGEDLMNSGTFNFTGLAGSTGQGFGNPTTGQAPNVTQIVNQAKTAWLR